MSSPNKALVLKWFDEVWNNTRVSAIDELLAGHGRLHGLGEKPLEGPAAFKPFHEAFVAAFPDIRIQIHELIEEGDKVAARYTCTGMNSGDGLGFAPTHRSATFTGMAIIRIEKRYGGGSVEQLRSAHDAAAAGIVPAPSTP